jgi:hypothetical protein
MAYLNFRTRLANLILGNNIQGLQHYERFIPKTQYNDYAEELEKLRVVMSNPALLRVIKIKCDLFSIGKIIEKDAQGEIVEESELQTFFEKPNFFQNQKQFLWDFMFWTCLGNARLMIDSKVVNDNNVMYWLDSSKVEFPKYILDNADKLVLSKQTFKKFQDQNIEYRYTNGTKINIPFKKIINYTDNTNGAGNWFNGFSTIEALYKVLSNSELSLDAKNTNLNLAGQFMVAHGGGLDSSMMQPEDKENIENKIGKGKKNIHAVRTAIDIKRFVEDIAKLKLDDSYNNDLQIIGSVYGIPKDVIEAFESSTYTNQQIARMSLVDYVLKPKSEDFLEGIRKHFDYANDLEMSWEHCSFMQESEEQRYSKELKRAHVLRRLLESGVDAVDAEALLNYEFTNPIKYEKGNTGASTGFGDGENS